MEIKILDIGCGDGLLTEEILKTGFNISATLIDGNDNMLKKAAERLKPFQNVNFLKASFQELLDDKPDIGLYDLCISSMAIHHLTMKEKALLFRYIASHLKIGGHFINVDNVLPPSAELEEWYFGIWKDWVGQQMSRHDINDETPDDLINRYKNPASMNKPDTLRDQLKALKEAGFSDVDCYFKNGIFVVFGGKICL
ncbi:MAG: class I SAM-dependent methyltransferase [Nitrospirae bacterium]|nr:class I SAM-dependent methyltransferase [Nitrospirota bacterium]